VNAYLGWKEIEAKFYPGTLTETQWKTIRATENLQRTDLTDPEVYATCTELMKLNPDWTRRALAEHLHMDPSWPTRILAVDDAIPAVREAFLAGRFRCSVAYEISKLPPEQQAEALALRLSGAKREDIEQQRRRSRHGSSGAAVKVSKIKCPLPSGATVQISGESLGLNDAIEAAQEWVKEARKACEQGLDAKTFERVCRDKSKAGG
jgi:hypothetical protein